MAATVPHQQPHRMSAGSQNMAVSNDSIPPEELIPPSDHRSHRSGCLILIVDDQVTNLKMLRQLLAHTPYQITFATSGSQALERVKSIQPDLILLDLMMPDMDGLAVCRHLQQNSQTADVPIIFLTASHETDHLLQAFDQGAVDYVTKPFHSPELLARIQTHLSLKEAKSALDSLNQHLDKQVQQRTAALQQALTFAGIAQRITQKVRDTLDETQMFATVAKELAQALNLDRCQIGIYDHTRSVSTIADEYVDRLPPTLGQVYPFNRFNTIYSQLHQGQTVQENLSASSTHALSQAAIFLACPLSDRETIIGDIWLYRLAPIAFSEHEIRLVEQIADQSAIAIRQARLYRSSQAQVKELERLNYAKDEFLKTISHELKTPLTTIKAAADTLQAILQQPEWQTKHQQSAEKALPLLLEGCDREIKLVDTLLEFAHLDIKTDSAHSRIVDVIRVDDLIVSITHPFNQRFQEGEQTFNLAIPPDLPLLQTNSEMLSRILIELLDNACKYTPPGETIELTAAQDNNRLQLLVSNSGVTLSETELSHIFDKFYRLPRYDRWQHGGVGLGLALVKKQIEFLGGTVCALQTDQRFTVKVELALHSDDA